LADNRSLASPHQRGFGDVQGIHHLDLSQHTELPYGGPTASSRRGQTDET
jgi:hypothetical protein